MINTIIVGGGYAAEKFHIPGFLENRNVRLVGVIEKSNERREYLKKVFKINTYNNLSELIKRQIKIDLVSIVTPPNTHFDLVMEIMKLKADIIIEKPIFLTTEEAISAKMHADEHGVRIIAVHNKAFSSVNQKLIKEREKFGKFRRIDFHWMSKGDENHMSKDPNHWSHKLHGGRWEELIPHMLYLSFRLVGPSKLIDVHIIKHNFRLQWIKGDELIVILESSDGFITFNLSATCNNNFFKIIGTNKSYISKDLNLNKDISFKNIFKRVFIKLKSLFNLSNSISSQHSNLINQVIQSKIKGSPLPVSWEEALYTLEMTQLIGQKINEKWSKLI